MGYIGRFAPSPSGPLHFGSLVTALASYLQSKASHGKWLVRIEDIDPPREVNGASSLILKTLEAFCLYWDDNVLYQSTRVHRYEEVIQALLDKKLAYYCDCSRQRVHHLPLGYYDSFCQNRYLSPSPRQALAIRLKQSNPVYQFIDRIRGIQHVEKSNAQEDFIIHRKDGLFAYNLAVVLDDYQQGITEVVRGADLLPVTGKQISLYQLFGWKPVSYAHLPLALEENGKKLSKQNHAKPIELSNVNRLTVQALLFLGQQLPNDWQDATQVQLLDWAINHWDIKRIPQQDRPLSSADIR